MTRTIEIDGSITVSALAEQLEITPTSLVAELFKNGIMATLNEKIDYDTASILVDELGLEVEIKQQEATAPEPIVKKARENAKLAARPPVVAVMGHVDHGKTSLLDKIREANVAEKEAGGITQHISAYQVEKNDRKITFLDTPGHEAFAAIREHGAALTDVAIIVVAADDGLKPQSLEAIRFAKKAGVKMIIAANKVDKDGANLDKLKAELSEQKLIPEDYGGDTVVVPVSAKTGEGIDKLLDMVLLVSDIDEPQADIAGMATGLIIEAHMQTGLGPVAIALVQQGILKKGNFLVAGETYGKAKVLKDSNGQEITEASPSTPVLISGFKALPEFGQEFYVAKNEKEAKKLASEFGQSHGLTSKGMTNTELLRIISRRSAQQELNIMVKADVQGSLTSVLDSIKSIETDDIQARVTGSGVGSVGENDIRTAAATDSIIYCFSLSVPQSMVKLAEQQGVAVKSYKVIYELLDDIKEEMQALLSPETVVTELGFLKVKGVFNTTKAETIAGGEVTKGTLKIPSRARVMRNKQEIADVEVTNLKKGPQDTHQVEKGEMCGINLKTEEKLGLLEGDYLELYSVAEKQRTL